MGVPKVLACFHFSWANATPVFQVDIRTMANVQSAHCRQHDTRVRSDKRTCRSWLKIWQSLPWYEWHHSQLYPSLARHNSLIPGTHKDEMGPTHKIPQEKMFLAIFNYIEHLYGKIKPKKLFFMAVDGTHCLSYCWLTCRCCPSSQDEPATRPTIPICQGRRRRKTESCFEGRRSPWRSIW